MPGTISGITPAELGQRIGANLRRLRKDRGFTQAALSKNCRCHIDTLRYYESGTRTSFEGLVILLRACQCLGVQLDDLVKE